MVFARDFRVVRPLSAGGMGAVYAAYDELLDRRIALKLMHRQRGGSVGQKQRTLVEARSLARITHPSIVTVYEVGEAEGHVYISMEYIEGPTLSDWCSDAPRSWRQILEMYLQAGEALAAAHAADRLGCLPILLLGRSPDDAERTGWLRQLPASSPTLLKPPIMRSRSLSSIVPSAAAAATRSRRAGCWPASANGGCCPLRSPRSRPAPGG